MKWISVFCLIFISLCVNFSHETRAESQVEKFIKEAEELFVQGNFFEAAIAFERAYFFSGDARQRMEANLGRAQALKQRGDFSKARRDLQRSAHLSRFPELHRQILYEMAFCDYMSANYSSAIGVLGQIQHFYPEFYDSPPVMLLYSLAAIMSEDWDLARDKTIELLLLNQFEPQKADSLMGKLDIFFCECSVPEKRSPDRAAKLSTFLPGTGHFYAGYPGKGLLNAGSQITSLGLAGYMAWSNLYISGFVIGLGMFQSFYFGGIRQAEYLAQQGNLNRMAAHKELLKDFVLDLYQLSEEQNVQGF
ncbi:MAG: hypothetical protein EA393_09330 [Bacteroidetes bacterium]|nr:MAG: hypothetical protein EA393_09330 [Bacteroidota bacterium]